MYQKKFVEAVNPLKPYDKSFDDIYRKLEKWVMRGKPIEVTGFQLFHNGELTDYGSLYELTNKIYKMRDQVNYCTCVVCIKTFEH